MIEKARTLGIYSRLLSYPDAHYVQLAELLYVIVQTELPEAAKCVSQFGQFVEQCTETELEEAYTRTFDVNPSCALEVGWHLFGEDYVRGQFLVRMREELAKYEIPESSELPDHLTHVLAVIGAMPEGEAERFTHACVFPALAKMQKSLDEDKSSSQSRMTPTPNPSPEDGGGRLGIRRSDKNGGGGLGVRCSGEDRGGGMGRDTKSPYRFLIRALVLVLEHLVGPAEPWSDEDWKISCDADAYPGQNGPRPRGLDDPLRAFPMPDTSCGDDDVDLVPLQMEYSSPADEPDRPEGQPAGRPT